MAGATFSRVKVWVVEVLKYADLNAEFDNILNNLNPAGIDDASTNNTAMQATTDPYPGSSISLPTSLEGELQRIRYVLAQITGETYWYIDPDCSLLQANSILTRGEWVLRNETFTYASGTTMTVPTNLTATFIQGYRIKAIVAAGTIYGTIKSSAFGATTLITVDWDSGALDATITSIFLGLISPYPCSIGVMPILVKTTDYTLAKTDLEQRFVASAASTQECTISIASPGVLTKVTHGLLATNRVRLTTTGVLPTGLVQDQTYYVSADGLTADVFSLSLTSGGARINTSGSQSGTHYFHRLITLTLPAPATIPNGRGYWLRNSGTGDVTISGTVSGVVDPVLKAGDEIEVRSDQTVWYGATNSIGPDVISDEVDGSTSKSLTVKQTWGTQITNLGQAAADITLMLPVAVAGCSFIATVGTARSNAWKFKAAATDKIYLDGTAGSDAGIVQIAAPTVGAFISFMTFKTATGVYDWVARTGQGLWVAA